MALQGTWMIEYHSQTIVDGQMVFKADNTCTYIGRCNGTYTENGSSFTAQAAVDPQPPYILYNEWTGTWSGDSGSGTMKHVPGLPDSQPLNFTMRRQS